MFVSKLTPEQWAEARQLRADGVSFAVIGDRFGIGRKSLADRARKERWEEAPSPAASRSAPHTRRAFPSPAAAAGVRALSRRLYAVLDLRIKMMELRMKKQLDEQMNALAAGEQPPPADDERETLGALIKNIQEVTELATDLDRTTHAGARSARSDARASEADALRRQIAERIKSLVPPS